MKTTIEIENDNARVIVNNDDGTVDTKTISVNSLCAAMSNIARITETDVPVGCRKVFKVKDKELYVFITPQFVGKAWVNWSKCDTSSFGSLTEHIPTEGEFEGKDFIRCFDVPYPATAIAVLVKREVDGTYTFNKMYCYALKNVMQPLVSMEAFAWPFTNVYTSGECCIGRITSSYPNVDSVASIPKTIFNGICNHDLSGPSNINREVGDSAALGHIKDSFELLIKSRTLRSFPTEYLKPLGDLNSIIKGIMANYM